MLDYINHITLNTGHIRKTYPDEVDKKLYFVLNRIFTDSFSPEGSPLFNGYYVKSVKSSYGILSTVFKNEIPIITIGITNSDPLNFLWKELHKSAYMPLKTKIDKPVEQPYIADRLEVGAVEYLDAMEWTGDFSKCLGWIYLSPKSIR